MNQDVDTEPELYKSFIFECLAARLNNSSLQKARALSQDPDFNWDALLQTADEELVSPLLQEILQERQIAPPGVEEALGRKYDFIARRNLFLLHHLTKILSLFAAAGIEAIVLKGAALTETVYQNIALRPMRDLDLLLRREQLPAALALLSAAGYAQKTGMLGTAYPVGLAKSGIEPVELELHWTLFHSLYYQQQLTMDWFWQTATLVKSGTGPMLVLGHEGQILHLCGHLLLHHIDKPQLLWRNDLAELIFRKKEMIRWDLLINTAQTFQLVLTLQEILPQLAREWGAPVPEAVLQRLHALVVSAGEKEAFALSTAAKRSEGEGYWLRFKEIKGWRRRLVYVLKWLLPAPGLLRERYGIKRPSLVPLAYPYHWWQGLRLVKEALMTRGR